MERIAGSSSPLSSMEISFRARKFAYQLSVINTAYTHRPAKPCVGAFGWAGKGRQVRLPHLCFPPAGLAAVGGALPASRQLFSRLFPLLITTPSRHLLSTTRRKTGCLQSVYVNTVHLLSPLSSNCSIAIFPSRASCILEESCQLPTPVFLLNFAQQLAFAHRTPEHLRRKII